MGNIRLLFYWSEKDIYLAVYKNSFPGVA